LAGYDYIVWPLYFSIRTGCADDGFCYRDRTSKSKQFRGKAGFGKKDRTEQSLIRFAEPFVPSPAPAGVLLFGEDGKSVVVGPAGVFPRNIVGTCCVAVEQDLPARNGSFQPSLYNVNVKIIQKTLSFIKFRREAASIVLHFNF
jgi:hypothetical protein